MRQLRGYSLIAGLVVLAACLLASRAPAGAACAAPKTSAHVFFVTDREPVADTQLFSGARGLAKTREAIVSSGIIGPVADRATMRTCQSESELFAAMRNDFDPRRGRHVLIYIHGYYTSFRGAVGDALSIQKTLRFNGPVLVYSWPSKVTSRLAYVNDDNNAGWSLIHFHALLAALLRTYPGLPISFAAHSLGARFAGDGIDFLHHGSCAKCIARAVFFAPDVDGDTLHASLAGAGLCIGRPPMAPTHAGAVTLYVSNKDAALRQSQRLHGHQRAGQAGNELILCGGVDTIDASYYKSSDKLGHSYQADPRIVDDVRAAFAGASPTALSRHLVKARRDGGQYYELR